MIPILRRIILAPQISSIRNRRASIRCKRYNSEPLGNKTYGFEHSRIRIDRHKFYGSMIPSVF